MTTGNVFFVDSGAAAAGNISGTFHGRDPERPFATLAYALDQCTADNGDVIFLCPGHSEAPTVTIDLDVAGVSIIGLGVGRNRPTFVPAFTIATDIVFNVSADDIKLSNIVIEDGANTGGNSVQIHIAAHGFVCEDCLIEQGAVNLYAVTVASNYDEFTFNRCVFKGTAANPDVAIDIGIGSGDCTDFIIQNCIFNYSASAGLDLAGVRSSKINTGVLIKDCTFINMDATVLDFNSSSTGLVVNVAAAMNSATLTVAECMDVGHLACVDVKLADKTTSGAIIPATTATP